MTRRTDLTEPEPQAGMEEPTPEPRSGVEEPGHDAGPGARRPHGSAAGPAAPAQRTGLEDFLGGRVLAWAGALTVLTGVVLLVAVAIGRGWIDESTRIVIAFGVTASLLAAGAWLYEKRGSTQAALAITGTGLAGLYLTLTAGAQLYHLYSAPLALAEAAVIGLVGTVLAVRWNSRTVASLAIGGAMLAPAFVGAAPSDLATGFVLVALASAVGVLLIRDWNWLAVGCFVIAAPQLLLWVGTEPAPLAVLAVMSAYGLVNAAAAFGHELRAQTGQLRPSSALLVLAGALVTAAGGYFGLRAHGQSAAGEWWMAGLALVHLVAGMWALRRSPITREVGLVTVGAGTALADVAFGTLASGPLVSVGWAASAGVLGLLVRRGGRNVPYARLALGSQLILAIGHVLLFDASPGAFLAGASDVSAALVGIGSVCITAFVCARLDGNDPRIAGAFDLVAAVSLAYGTAFALEGPALAIAWAGIAAALSATIGRDVLGFFVSAAFLSLAGLHVVAYEAPMDALAYGVRDLPGTAAVLVAVATAGFAISRQLTAPEQRQLRTGFEASAAVALLYLASVVVVDVFQPSTDTFESGFALSVRQQGQVLLSGLWAAAGALALVGGLRTERLELRVAGFGLLAVAFGKVLVFDLSTLDSIYRVASCVGLGVLLLASAFAYQRVRPRIR